MMGFCFYIYVPQKYYPAVAVLIFTTQQLWMIPNQSTSKKSLTRFHPNCKGNILPACSLPVGIFVDFFLQTFCTSH